MAPFHLWVGDVTDPGALRCHLEPDSGADVTKLAVVASRSLLTDSSRCQASSIQQFNKTGLFWRVAVTQPHGD
ncbi:hypothetical protein EYF80_033413 [Liparis tanakae]|uniref:Uncharacterized protein n=1 Tax=Liparis tanakae TaxID=230148 RepID=A0A4Z2GS27_9TELE|nr:hypothetical protein EYF80_033413 [Liparis tanakae]